MYDAKETIPKENRFLVSHNDTPGPGRYSNHLKLADKIKYSRNDCSSSIFKSQT